MTQGFLKARCTFLMLARGACGADDEDAAAMAAVCCVWRHGDGDDGGLGLGLSRVV